MESRSTIKVLNEGPRSSPVVTVPSSLSNYDGARAPVSAIWAFPSISNVAILPATNSL